MRTVAERNRRQCYDNEAFEFVVHCFVLLCLLCYSIGSVNSIRPAGSIHEVETTVSTIEPITEKEPSVTIEPVTTEELTEIAVEETEQPVEESEYPKFVYSKDWDANTSYLLAKIAMAEAEGCSTETKEFVILTILNRVWSDGFPNTVEGVIFQKVSGVAQFTPTVNGRWDRVEPNADCWTALHNVETATYDKSQGCTFFESCANPDNWHSRNLTFLFESDGVRFYRDK